MNINTPDYTAQDQWSATEALILTILRQQVSTAMPCEVVAVSQDKKKVSVRELVVDRDNTNPPVIYHNIMVLQPWGKTAGLTIPLTPGDQGLLITCKKDISEYKKTGALAKTNLDRVFDQNDSVYLPLAPQHQGHADDDRVKLRYKTSQLTLSEDQITLIRGGSSQDNRTQSHLWFKDDRIELEASDLSLAASTITSDPLREVVDHLLDLMDKLASGMMGSSTTPTQFRATQPLIKTKIDAILKKRGRELGAPPAEGEEA